MNIVVLISGNGSNLQAIIDACKTNKIKGTVRAVFSNKADAFGLERARQAGIATHTLIASAFDSREAYDRELIHEIDMYAPMWSCWLVLCTFSARRLSPTMPGVC